MEALVLTEGNLTGENAKILNKEFKSWTHIKLPKKEEQSYEQARIVKEQIDTNNYKTVVFPSPVLLTQIWKLEENCPNPSKNLEYYRLWTWDDKNKEWGIT